MQFSDAEAELLKKWIIKKLEDISDADSDVLADYVLALVRSDDPDDEVKSNCVSSLRDFLPDDPESFVEGLFSAIANGSYDPSRPQPPRKVASRSFKAPQPPRLEYPRQGVESRKRGYRDWDRDESQDATALASEITPRLSKQVRRGRAGFNHRDNRHSHPLERQAFPNPPTPPPGMPPFDPNNPLTSMFAIQQAFGLIPGMPSFPNTGASPQDNGFLRYSGKRRCVDYDNRGFCTMGASCPYEHGAGNTTVPQDDEYDPRQVKLLNSQADSTGMMQASSQDRRSQGKGGRNGKKWGDAHKASHMHAGNRSNTTVVVAQIPEQDFDEQSVRGFFGAFGNISNVTMRSYKRTALITYDDHDSAQAAYDSPKVIFDNRFVKVYWDKPDVLPHLEGQAETRRTNEPTNGAGTTGETLQLDLEEFAKRQEEFQERQDRRKKALEEVATKRAEVDAQLKVINDERQKILSRLAKKSGNDISPVHAHTASQVDESEQTKELREKLAQLEAEAKSLGIDPDAATETYSYYNTRGRGGFRGRPRGRSSYHGFRAGRGAGAVMRLDNRPKTVAVTFTDGSFDSHDEALRHWLLFSSSGSGELSKHPVRADIALVAFPERYLGEIFMASASASDFPLAGAVELSWYKSEDVNGPHNTDMKREDGTNSTVMETKDDDTPIRDPDTYDVADENDHWG